MKVTVSVESWLLLSATHFCREFDKEQKGTGSTCRCRSCIIHDYGRKKSNLHNSILIFHAMCDMLEGFYIYNMRFKSAALSLIETADDIKYGV